MQKGLLRCKRVINHSFSRFCLSDQTAALSFREGNDSMSKSLFTVASQAWEYERVSKSLSYSSDAQANTAELLTECYLCASRSPVVVLTAVLTAFSAIFAVHRRLFRPQCHGKRRSKTLPTKKSSQKKQHSQLLPGLRCATGT